MSLSASSIIIEVREVAYCRIETVKKHNYCST